MLKTLAAKHKSTVAKMAARHKAKVITGTGCGPASRPGSSATGKKDLVARFGGIPLKRDKRAVITDPAPVPVHPPRKELIHRLRKRRCELCDHGATVAVHQVARLAQPRQARAGPARVGGPHGQETAQDPHRLPPLPRLHPRQPRRERGISHWRAQCTERCPLGSEGGCAEKARVHDSEPGTSPRSPPCHLAVCC